MFERFAQEVKRVRAGRERFVAAGVEQGRRVELQGGGLIRSVGGWTAMQELHREREHYAGDERILGASAFVEAVRQEVEVEGSFQSSNRYQGLTLTVVLTIVCQAVGTMVAGVLGGGRRSIVSRVREGWRTCE